MVSADVAIPEWVKALPFRLGTTSYIIPAEILPNVRYLAGHVQDVELILFELDDGLNNLPDEDTINELRRLADEYDLSYTIHLPLDLDLGAVGEERSKTLRKTHRAIETTRSLDAWAYVLHLDSDGLRQNSRGTRLANPNNFASAWQARAVQGLELLGEWVGSRNRLAVENLDGYPPDFNFPVFEDTVVAQCIDIGHLWKEGENPIDYLDMCLHRTRVIHLHGIKERDHQSLAHMPIKQIDEVLNRLVTAPFKGVVTLEVFSESDLNSSLQAIQSCLSRLAYL